MSTTNYSATPCFGQQLPETIMNHKTERVCEAQTRTGGRCRRPGVYYLSHEHGEYLVCKRHHNHEFQPAAGVIPRTGVEYCHDLPN